MSPLGKGGIPLNEPIAFASQLVQSPVTFHALLMRVAAWYSMKVVNKTLAATEYFRNATSTIRLVNEGLDDPNERYSDAIAGAITLLARNEVSKSPRFTERKDPQYNAFSVTVLTKLIASSRKF
jgi:hypothetical protein